MIAFYDRNKERTLILSGFAKEEVAKAIDGPGTLLRPYAESGNPHLGVAITTEKGYLNKFRKSCEDSGIHQLLVFAIDTDYEALRDFGIRQICWSIRWNCIEYFVPEEYMNIYGAAASPGDHQTVWTVLFGDTDEDMVKAVEESGVTVNEEG